MLDNILGEPECLFGWGRASLMRDLRPIAARSLGLSKRIEQGGRLAASDRTLAQA